MSSLRASLFSRPAGFVPDPRFGAGIEPAGKPTPEHDAYERGYAQGHAAAMDEMQAQATQECEEITRLLEGLALWHGQVTTDLAGKLRELVISLCEKSLEPLALDETLLVRRIERALALFQRSGDSHRVFLNPADHARISACLPDNPCIVPDPSLAPGALRTECEDGGVEDGPKQWRMMLDEAFGQC
ncbi:MAG: FliH/SctL family protein [Sphingomonadaceae bacterium]